MTSRPSESQAIDRVAENYRRRGYQVIVGPSVSDSPEFLESYRPDIIARSSADSVVIEVKVGTQTSVVERFQEIAARINGQPGWRFSLVYVSPTDPAQFIEAEPAPLADLEQRAQRAESLLLTNQTDAAFLLFWSVLEGVLRILSRRAQLPLESLPPSALIRELYSGGELSREEFDTLVRLLPVRHRLVHGLVEQPDRATVEPLRTLVTTLLASAKS